MSEEVKGKLLAASGKAKLLINQKLEQFKGLCFKNINTSPSDEFATTNEDLAGFWDMVKIQVENVKDLFKEIDQLRLNNWKEVKNQVPNSTNKIPAKKVITTKKLKSTKTDATKKAIKSDKQESSSDERRKQMREALNAKRKQAMKMKNSIFHIKIIFHFYLRSYVGVSFNFCTKLLHGSTIELTSVVGLLNSLNKFVDECREKFDYCEQQSRPGSGRSTYNSDCWRVT
ncbi:Disks large-associated protein 4 [Armadillidium nasatum]|uniref:Disks large-associated protein 4 n=1 Tax=Armadillidium nasatum TaxID=96803 RepID=A0A5N5TL94_9CRUS|nr:Disks large-associated protein 4 [Armadillidium nasatum]